jgi:hypothetical protein
MMSAKYSLFATIYQIARRFGARPRRDDEILVPTRRD